MTANALVEVGSASHASAIDSKRRWFHSLQMDLYVWVDDSDQPYGFELSYRKVTTEYSFRWDAEGGFTHSKVDSAPGAGGHTASDLLGTTSAVDISYIRNIFAEAAGNLPPPIRALVQDALALYPQSPVALGSRPTPSQVRARRPFHISGDGLGWVVALLLVIWALYALGQQGVRAP
jgi:hypothetical protein